MNSSTIVFDFSANKINKMHNSVTESVNSILTKRTNFHRIILYTHNAYLLTWQSMKRLMYKFNVCSIQL